MVEQPALQQQTCALVRTFAVVGVTIAATLVTLQLRHWVGAGKA